MPGAVYITGASGFLGRNVVKRFQLSGWNVLAEPSSRLDVRRTFTVPHETRLIVHCAARVGGIGANRLRPATFFADNMRMGLAALDAAVVRAVPILMIGTTCSYPCDIKPPFQESDLWEGYPEATNAPYGVAKRALVTAAEAYQAEFGLRVSTLILANLYGPGDNNDVVSSHVVPAVVAKVAHAVTRHEKTITLWGDGSPTRDLLYIDDAARAVHAAGQLLVSVATPLAIGPFNVGTGSEISIRELAHKIIDLFGGGIEVVWDHSAPNGQPRRALDSGLFRAHVGWKPVVSLDEGLQRTVEAALGGARE